MNFVLFLLDWVVGLNNTHQLVIPGCDVELCDFELSWSRWSNQQLFDQQSIVSTAALGLCDWGQRAILGGQLDSVFMDIW